MNKQIKEMANDVCPLYKEYGSCKKCDEELDIEDDPCIYQCMANLFASAGYRKASEVAREIFAEIEKATEHYISKIKEMEKNLESISEFYGGAITASNLMLNIIAELKKKYI